MRIVKQRLLELIPDLSVFLEYMTVPSNSRVLCIALSRSLPWHPAGFANDPRSISGDRSVDDLEEIGALESYIARTSVILVCTLAEGRALGVGYRGSHANVPLALADCSKGYFTSKNCMRELVSSTVKRKPIIALIDLEASHGGMTLSEIEQQLFEADALYAKWAFNNEPEAPRAKALHTHLFGSQPIEWNRIGHFQDVTMRQLSERLLPDPAGSTYVDREIVHHKGGKLRLPKASYHMYCSELNMGAKALVMEVCHASGFEAQFHKAAAEKPDKPAELCISTDADKLQSCDHMLLYLTSQTWTSGFESTTLADELRIAMDLGVHVLLAHEMPGIGQDGRFSCDFGTFFGHPDGATPGDLLKRGIYSSIAVRVAPNHVPPPHYPSYPVLRSPLTLTSCCLHIHRCRSRAGHGARPAWR